MKCTLLLLVIVSLTLAACGSRPVEPTPLPTPTSTPVKVNTPTPIPSPTPTITPAPTAVLPPAPPIEELITEYNQVIVPLNESFLGSAPPPDSFTLPSSSEWEISLLPLHDRLYAAQRLLNQDKILSNPSATVKLYLVYDYDRYRDLMALPNFETATSELGVRQALLAEIDGVHYYLENTEKSSGEDARDLNEMVQISTVPLEKLGELAPEAEATIEMIIRAAIGLDNPNYDLGRRIAWLRLALSSTNWADQFAALNSLDRIGLEATIPARSEIIQLLSSENSQVVEMAAETLGGMGREAIAAVPVLIGLLSHEDEWIRSAAVAALQEISGEQFGEDATQWENWYNLNQ